jgi:hypothetical protein
MTEFDKDLLSGLKPEIDSGIIAVSDNSDYYFKVVASKFKTRLGRVVWEDANLIWSSSESYESLYAVLLKIGDENSLFDKYFHLFGDNLTHLVYKMPFNTLLDKFELFRQIPQHLFAIGEEETYCLNYTFEDDLYWGVC